jgi:6-pyruvoyltetrahydropterin/6-carboxytetrahydropterin synthase
MYTLCVRDHMMIAHSFTGAVFGPAQKLHGATYVIDVEFRRSTLDADGLVVDIGRASETLKGLLATLNYKNLDDDPEFAGRNTTTEFLARALFDRMVAAIHRGDLGAGARGIETVRVALHESHLAWAAYEGPVNERSTR